MNKPYVVKVGVPDDLKQVDSEGDREFLIHASNVYEAHKSALLEKCSGPKEVLDITINGHRVYDINTGFKPE